MKLVNRIASVVVALQNCRKSGNSAWILRHMNTLRELNEKYLPHGSGFDQGTSIDMDASTSLQLLFLTSFHAMDETGGYDGWYDYRIVVTPDLVTGFNIRVVGKDYHHTLKDYVADTFVDILNQEIPEEPQQVLPIPAVKETNHE